jgi:hypothetical protein
MLIHLVLTNDLFGAFVYLFSSLAGEDAAHVFVRFTRSFSTSHDPGTALAAISFNFTVDARDHRPCFRYDLSALLNVHGGDLSA